MGTTTTSTRPGALSEALDAPVWLHPDDLMLWDAEYPDRPPDGPLADGMSMTVGGITLRVIHTPGHSPGGCCLHDGSGSVLFSGDTLFNGGPGATGRRYSDFPTIIESIRDRPAGPARGHQSPDRARRRDHHRRRGPPSEEWIHDRS